MQQSYVRQLSAWRELSTYTQFHLACDTKVHLLYSLDVVTLWKVIIYEHLKSFECCKFDYKAQLNEVVLKHAEYVQETES